MPETGATYVPRPLDDIESDPLSEAFAAITGLSVGRIASGLVVTYDVLTAHVSPGWGVVVTGESPPNPPSAYYVVLTQQVDKPILDNTTNFLFLTHDANVVVNQTGIAPNGAIALGALTTAGGVVTGTNFTARQSRIHLGVAIRAVGADLANAEMTNLGPPTVGTSAARLQDVTDALSNLKAIKNPVRVATTAAITRSGLQTIDGIALSSGDRVLDKDAAAAAERGIYVAQSGAWVRATDFDASAEVIGGVLIAVAAGATNGGSVYGLDTVDPIVLGTTALTFTRKDVVAHAALTTAHGATSSPTANRIPVRDANGTFEVGTATSGAHPATLTQLNASVAAETTARIADVDAEEAARISADNAEAAARANGDAAAQAAAIAFAIQRANHTGVQTAATISDFSAAVTAHRLDQMAPPTAPLSLNNQRITNLAPPTGVADAATKGYVDPYSRIDVTVAPVVGTVLWEGPLHPAALVSSGNQSTSPVIVVGPGTAGIGFPTTTGGTIPGMVSLMGHLVGQDGSTTVPAAQGLAFNFAKGTKTTVKGGYTAFSDTPIASAYERFGILLHRPQLAGQNLFLYTAGAHTLQVSFSETEANRDDYDAIGFIVNDSEQVKRLNVAQGGDASYTDPAGGATVVDLTAGIWFEISVEVPRAADSMNDAIVTITVNGVSVYSAQAPAGTATGGGLFLLAALNQNGLLYRLTGKIELAA